mmetsp:Transcript_9043/g.31490  ORF Transcript_9043/g.31490 Transcript_9043/m.31490 type:complete len:213 (-) Transcript_9043:678-1316(-)
MWCDTLLTFCAMLSWMFLALFAYLSVFTVSSRYPSAGLAVAIMVVRQFPPKLSFSSLVSFESRKGTYAPLFALSPRALMQLPRASSERLMLAPSIILLPMFFVFAARSDPARSMRLSLPTRTGVTMFGVFSFCSTVTCSTACDLLLYTFALVASCVLCLLPLLRSSITSRWLLASTSCIPATHIPFTGSSRRSRKVLLGVNRSRMFSLYTSR